LTTGCIPDLSKLSFVDRRIDLSGSLPGGATDLRQLHGLNNVNLPDPSQQLAPAPQGNMGSATSSFTSGVSKPGSIHFSILEPSTIFHLILGQPAELVVIQLPEFGFNFFYRQQFPIIGPLVGTFAGGVGATINLRIGYDTQGLSDFLASHNAASLAEGFFFDTKDAAGQLMDVATLHAEIAVGAALSAFFFSFGVEGGITADIHFLWSDLNGDGKVRFDELLANLLANAGDPLAVFDIRGQLGLFLRAYITIDLGFF